MKTSRSCHCEKEGSEFFRHSAENDGLQPNWKVCDDERTKAYGRKNPEKIAGKGGRMEFLI